MAFCTSCGSSAVGRFCGSCGAETPNIADTQPATTATTSETLLSQQTQMLRDFHEDRFRPRIFLALLAGTLGWIVLVPCYFIYAFLLGVVSNVGFLNESGIGWYVLLLSGVPFWFLFNWILRFSNIKRMARIPCIAATGIVVLWSTLPAIIIALATSGTYLNNHPHQVGTDDTIPSITAWALGAVLFGLAHMPEKSDTTSTAKSESSVA